jgi:hypothetical protein
MGSTDALGQFGVRPLEPTPVPEKSGLMTRRLCH